MRRRQFLVGALAIGFLAGGGQLTDSQAKKGRDEVRNESGPGGLDDSTDSRGRHGGSGSSNSGSGSSGSSNSGSGSGSDDGYSGGDSSGSDHGGSERARWEGRNGSKWRNARDDLDRF